MSVRRLSVLALAIFVATAPALVSEAAAQAVQLRDPGSWVLPRTADGHPDLQGNWTNATLTPMSRPSGLGPVLTPEQAREIEARQERALEEGTAASDPYRAAPQAGGTHPVCIDGATSCYDEVYRDPGESVAIVNGELRSSLITFPADGRIPATLPEARARAAAGRALTSGFGVYDHPEVRPLAERCLLSFGSNAGPPMLPNGWYNNNYTIVQTPDHVMIMTEMVHDTRIIQIGNGPRLPPQVRPWLGDSWGRWEGDTLVVETTNFHPMQQFSGMPSENLRVIERFSRADEETLLYEFEIDDPTVYTERWGGQVPFRRLDGLVYEYACHEGNYALGNILSGARYEERMEAEGAQIAVEPR
jgi:hypothetical protein